VTHKPELCRYDIRAIAQAEDEMFERVRRSNNPNAPRTPSDLACKYCRAAAAGTCKEHLAWRGALVPGPSPFYVAMQDWTPEQRAAAASILPSLTALVDDAREFLKKCLKDDPESVPGFCLKPGAILRPVTDAEALFARFVELGGTLEQFMKCVEIRKGEFEGQVRAVVPLKGKALAAQLNKLLDGVTTDKPNQPSIAKKKGKQ